MVIIVIADLLMQPLEASLPKGLGGSRRALWFLKCAERNARPPRSALPWGKSK